MPNFKNELWSKFEHQIQLSDFFDGRDPENEEIFADAGIDNKSPAELRSLLIQFAALSDMSVKKLASLTGVAKENVGNAFLEYLSRTKDKTFAQLKAQKPNVIIEEPEKDEVKMPSLEEAQKSIDATVKKIVPIPNKLNYENDVPDRSEFVRKTYEAQKTTGEKLLFTTMMMAKLGSGVKVDPKEEKTYRELGQRCLNELALGDADIEKTLADVEKIHTMLALGTGRELTEAEEIFEGVEDSEDKAAFAVMNGGTFHYRMYSQFALNLEDMIRETYIQKHAADFKLDADTTLAEYTKAAGMNDKEAARYMKQNGFTPEMKAFDAYGINGKNDEQKKAAIQVLRYQAAVVKYDILREKARKNAAKFLKKSEKAFYAKALKFGERNEKGEIFDPADHLEEYWTKGIGSSLATELRAKLTPDTDLKFDLMLTTETPLTVQNNDLNTFFIKKEFEFHNQRATRLKVEENVGAEIKDQEKKNEEPNVVEKGEVKNEVKNVQEKKPENHQVNAPVQPVNNQVNAPMQPVNNQANVQAGQAENEAAPAAPEKKDTKAETIISNFRMQYSFPGICRTATGVSEAISGVSHFFLTDSTGHFNKMKNNAKNLKKAADQMLKTVMDKNKQLSRQEFEAVLDLVNETEKEMLLYLEGKHKQIEANPERKSDGSRSYEQERITAVLRSLESISEMKSAMNALMGRGNVRSEKHERDNMIRYYKNELIHDPEINKDMSFVAARLKSGELETENAFSYDAFKQCVDAWNSHDITPMANFMTRCIQDFTESFTGTTMEGDAKKNLYRAEICVKMKKLLENDPQLMAAAVQSGLMPETLKSLDGMEQLCKYAFRRDEEMKVGPERAGRWTKQTKIEHYTDLMMYRLIQENELILKEAILEDAAKKNAYDKEVQEGILGYFKTFKDKDMAEILFGNSIDYKILKNEKNGELSEEDVLKYAKDMVDFIGKYENDLIEGYEHALGIHDPEKLQFGVEHPDVEDPETGVKRKMNMYELGELNARRNTRAEWEGLSRREKLERALAMEERYIRTGMQPLGRPDGPEMNGEEEKVSFVQTGRGVQKMYFVKYNQYLESIEAAKEKIPAVKALVNAADQKLYRQNRDRNLSGFVTDLGNPVTENRKREMIRNYITDKGLYKLPIGEFIDKASGIENAFFDPKEAPERVAGSLEERLTAHQKEFEAKKTQQKEAVKTKKLTITTSSKKRNEVQKMDRVMK